jgi:hypothetical protein
MEVQFPDQIRTSLKCGSGKPATTVGQKRCEQVPVLAYDMRMEEHQAIIQAPYPKPNLPDPVKANQTFLYSHSFQEMIIIQT